MSARRRGKSPLYDLVDPDCIDRAHTFHIAHHKRDPQNEIKHAYWTSIKHEGQKSSEGKVFIPEHPQGSRLIVFETGMPGDGTCATVEEKFLPDFMKAGYHAMILRHVGTWMDADSRSGQNSMISSRTRVHLGQKLNESTLGEDRPYGARGLASEVIDTANAFGPNFDEVALIGHSSGALACLWSVPKIESDVRQKITHVVSLAGLTGGIENIGWLTRWGIHRYLKDCQRYINLKDPAEVLQGMQSMFRDIYDDTLPENTMLIQVNTPKDEYIHPNAAAKLQEHYGRGLNIRDETQMVHKYHHLKNLQSSTLLRLLKTHHPSLKHSVTVKETEPKK
jgi:hypothetical protein